MNSNTGNFERFIPEAGDEQTTIHTPGPWHAQESRGNRYGSYQIRECGTRHRQRLTQNDRTVYSEAEREANAHLIAAAPQFKEACWALMKIVKDLDIGADDHPDVPDAYSKCIDAFQTLSGHTLDLS